MSKEITTPAPWYAMTDQNGNWQLQEGREYYHPYENLLHFSDFPDEAEANAKLAAQAPVLRDIVEKQTEYIKIANVMIYEGLTRYSEHESRLSKLRDGIETLKQQL